MNRLLLLSIVKFLFLLTSLITVTSSFINYTDGYPYCLYKGAYLLSTDANNKPKGGYECKEGSCMDDICDLLSSPGVFTVKVSLNDAPVIPTYVYNDYVNIVGIILLIIGIFLEFCNLVYYLVDILKY
jgi:hypothetical protein